jgi:hypothetical protein
MKLLPSYTMASGLCGDQIRPPRPCGTPELLCCKHGFLVFRALDKFNFCSIDRSQSSASSGSSAFENTGGRVSVKST